MNKTQIIKALKEEKRKVVLDYENYIKNTLDNFKRDYIIQKEGVVEFAEGLIEAGELLQGAVDEFATTELAETISRNPFKYIPDKISSLEAIVDEIRFYVSWYDIEEYNNLCDKLYETKTILSSNYANIIENVKMCKNAKQALQYLKDIGIEFEKPVETEIQLPSRIVDATLINSTKQLLKNVKK